MKKILFSLAAIVFLVLNSSGQSNNPYDKFGAEIVSAAIVINEDFQNGKLKDITQETLDNYFKTLLPNYSLLKMDDFLKIIAMMKNSNNESIVKNSGFSDEGKAFLNKSLTNGSITALVDEVKNSKISEKEKQSVLSVLAVNYNLIKPLSKNTNATTPTTKGPNTNFDIDYNSSLRTYAKPFSVVIFGGLGYIFGASVFTSSAAIAASTVVGIVAGGILHERGPRATVGTYNSGNGNNGSGGWHPQP